jgi:acyl-coenzyme A thioesterase PaaI-like protein
VAKADVVRIGSQLIVVECKVYDEDDHIIAAADFSMMRVPIRQPLDHEQGQNES